MIHITAGPGPFETPASRPSVPLNPTNRQHKNEYQGFARYADYSPATPQQQAAARTQSLASASMAAAAALQLHAKPAQPSGLQLSNPHYRTSSLSGNRSNSMRSYTYNPRPSYQTGPAARSNSLRSGVGSHSLRSNSLGLRQISRAGAQNAAAFRQAPYHPVPEEEQDDSVVVTTKTTKVVDAYGRTTSITLETIRKLADGSNIIETKTTNISRPTSRSNSFRANSLSHGAANHNLDKIDEDLQDFDYTYLEHDDGSPPRLNVVDKPAVFNSPKTDRYLQEQRKALLDHSPPKKNDDRNASMVSTQSARRLKSILKSSSGMAAEDSLLDVVPYASDQGKRLERSPNLKSTQMSNASGTNSIKFHETVETISYPADERNVAVLQKEALAQEEQEKQKNVDLFAQAMKVAMRNVYGDSGENTLETAPPPASPLLTQEQHPPSEVGELAAKKIKKDHKRGHVELGGVNKNYIYENHHKDFAVRSLRGANPTDASTRKKRVKEEMKLHKEEEKRQAELLKSAQKEKKKQEKALKKEFNESKEPKDPKEPKKKKHLSLFGLSKRKSSISESVLSTVVLGATVATTLLDHSDSQIRSADNSHMVDLLVTANSSDYDDTQEHFVDVPDVIEEDEEEHSLRPKILVDDDIESLRENMEPVEHEATALSDCADARDSAAPNPNLDPSALPTLVSLANGHPQVLTTSSRNIDNDTPSPNLGGLASSSIESNHDVVEKTHTWHVELDSWNNKSPKQRNREAIALNVDSASPSPSVSPDAEPKVQLFQAQEVLGQVDGVDVHSSGQQEFTDRPVIENLAESVSSTSPTLDVGESTDATAAPNSAQLSSPFVASGKQGVAERDAAGTHSIETANSGAIVNEEILVSEIHDPVAEDKGITESVAPTFGNQPQYRDQAHVVADAESSGVADISEVTAHEQLQDEVFPEANKKEEKSKKKQKVKKPSKFKKMIDKYFINTYSR